MYKDYILRYVFFINIKYYLSTYVIFQILNLNRIFNFIFKLRWRVYLYKLIANIREK